MSKSITWKVIIIWSLFLIISGWTLAGKDNLFAYSDKDNKTQPGVLMLLLDDTYPGPPPPAQTLHVLDTGQTKCYNNTQEITCPEPGEAFYGQDAHYQPRVPRSYTKLGEGGIELPDNASHIDAGGPWIMTREDVTGLVWEVKRDDPGLQYMNNTYTWYDPETENQGTQNDGTCIGSECDTYSYIQALNHPDLEFGGLSEWRLPTRRELCSLISWDKYDPVMDTDWFPNTVSDIYWTSTNVASGTSVWVINYKIGQVNTYPMSISLYVLAVYGEALPGSSFEDNLDGTVTDLATGLMWQKCSSGQSWNGNECTGPHEEIYWEEALNNSESLILAGYNDWRLPNINELLTLVDEDDHSPAINALFEANTENFDYWSSTTFANAPTGAWNVDFEYGRVYARSKSGFTRSMRAVRTVTD